MKKTSSGKVGSKVAKTVDRRKFLTGVAVAGAAAVAGDAKASDPAERRGDA